MGIELVFTIICYFLVFITSLCFGSFLNVVIYRLPNKMSLVSPPSHCPKCNSKIKWYDNIPILSYILLKGKCRVCKEKISIRYLLVEAMTAIISLLIYIRFGNSWLSLISILVLFCFIAIFFIDAEHYEIPDSLNVIICILGIISMFIAPIDYVKNTIIINYVDKLITIPVVLIILLIIFIGEKISKKELMGGGDIKLMAAVGLFIGWQLMLLGVVIASIIGCIIEILLKRMIKKENNQNSNVLPFGPYLVTGFLISLLFGLNILSWYINLF